MLVRINGVDSIKSRIKVTQLDIDDYGSVIPLKDLELNISKDDESIIQTLKNSSYAAIFTEDSMEENKSVIILANGMTIDELNREKSKTIDKAANVRQI
jgi:ABC-type Na+ transport system ATPase subunit NatA